MVSAAPVLTTDLRLPGKRAGKVRDVYELPDAALAASARPERSGARGPFLLIVATDRVSAYDVVMPTPIPGKGALLTALSEFWMGSIERAGICPTQRTGLGIDDIAGSVFTERSPRESMRGRSVIVRRTRVIPVECVVRGYLEGSGWKEYRQSGSVCGVALPAGLRQCDRLPEPIFTPATKEAVGTHDVNVSFDEAATRVGRRAMERLRSVSLAIYAHAAAHAAARGILLADTKFEFGVPVNDRGQAGDANDDATPILLIDEALTPDSSRYWPLDGYAPGGPQRSYDKQYLREYLEGLTARGLWNKQAPGPPLPAEIVERTLEKYRQACTLLMER